jgi:hypothetical protein
MIPGLVLEATGWFGLQVAVAAGTSGVLVCPGDGGIHADVPHDRPGGVGECLQHLHDERPHPGALPTPEQSVDRLPASIYLQYCIFALL